MGFYNRIDGKSLNQSVFYTENVFLHIYILVLDIFRQCLIIVIVIIILCQFIVVVY